MGEMPYDEEGKIPLWLDCDPGQNVAPAASVYSLTSTRTRCEDIISQEEDES